MRVAHDPKGERRKPRVIQSEALHSDRRSGFSFPLGSCFRRNDDQEFSHGTAALRLHPGQPANGTSYIGVTSDPVKRVWQHKHDLVERFTRDHSVHSLVWFEQQQTMESAIQREKALKKWKRDWKRELIEETNPDWQD